MARTPTALLISITGMAVGLLVGACSTKTSASSAGAGGAAGGGAGGGGAAAGAGGAPAFDAGEEGGAADGGSDAGDAGSTADAPAPLPFTASYHIGADITWVQHDEYYGATYLDTDGTPKDILALLKGHGFNSIRMRAFVDPRAYDGYDTVAGFGDVAHTVTMAQRIKNAGMGLYLALHYSDNWADPGKQCVPISWQGLTTISALAGAVHDYTFNFLTALQAVDALPEFVQVGNEITNGMLMHICDNNGLPTAMNPVNGSVASWSNLAMLLKAGIAAVKEVNPNIKTVLHIERAGDAAASVAFVNNALAQMVAFDVLGESTYVRYQGQPSGWQTTFGTLASTFPNLSFLSAEYENETATDPALPSSVPFVNDLIYNLPDSRGLGTWIFEPEHPFQAGPAAGVSLGIGLFDGQRTDSGPETQDSWPVFPALPGAMALYDALKTSYASRL